jgi:hypothetical protein
MNFCSKCGGSVGDTDFECPRCGNCVIPQATKVEVTESVRKEVARQGGNETAWGFLISLLACGMVEFILVVLRMKGFETIGGIRIFRAMWLFVPAMILLGLTGGYAIGFVRRRKSCEHDPRRSSNE